MRFHATCFYFKGFDNLQLSEDTGGNDNELSRMFFDLFASTYRRYVKERKREANRTAAVRKEIEAVRVKIESRAENAIESCVRVTAAFTADGRGCPRCRISIAKPKMRVEVRTWNFAVEEANRMYAVAEAVRKNIAKAGKHVEELFTKFVTVKLDLDGVSMI